MPLLVKGKDEKGIVVDAPRDPASFTCILERRIEAPQDVRTAWQTNDIFTGDGSTAGTEGDHLIVFDAWPLGQMDSGSELYNGAFVLPANAWQDFISEIRNDDSKGVYLNPEEVEQAHGKGYVKNGGVWVPANRSVAKVWDALSRGRGLTSYVRLVSEDSPYSNNLLNVYFNKTIKEGRPTMRSWVAYGIGSDTGASSDWDLNKRNGLLVGIVPEEHVAPEKGLEAQVQSALESGSTFEYNGRGYAPVSGV
jgi:hypothetical protein